MRELGDNKAGGCLMDPPFWGGAFEGEGGRKGLRLFEFNYMPCRAGVKRTSRSPLNNLPRFEGFPSKLPYFGSLVVTRLYSACRSRIREREQNCILLLRTRFAWGLKSEKNFPAKVVCESTVPPPAGLKRNEAIQARETESSTLSTIKPHERAKKREILKNRSGS